MKVKVTFGDLILYGDFFDTPCAQAIYKILPIEAEVAFWGDEIYFPIDLYWPLDHTATNKVRVGDIGYWPPGRALAIFFGPTPLSTGEEPVPASEVNLVGRLEGAQALKGQRGQKRIRIEPA